MASLDGSDAWIRDRVRIRTALLETSSVRSDTAGRREEVVFDHNADLGKFCQHRVSGTTSY